MKKSNVTDTYGNALIYDTCYLVYDQEPVIFKCHFEGDPPEIQFIGIMVDMFDASEYGGDEGELVMNYYLATVNDAIVYNLESRNYTLHDLFHTGHLTWITHRYSETNKKHSTIMQIHARIASRYQIAKDSTLCQN